MVAAEGHPLALDEGSDTDVEEARDPGVAANTSVPAVDVGSDTDVEEEVAKNPDVVTKSYRHALPGSRETDVAGPEGKPDVRPTDHRPAENVGSDTDVEEGKPDVGRQREPVVAGDGDTDVEEAEGKPDVGRQREPAVAGDGDTDVEEAEGKPDVGRQREPAVAGDGDTDVEEAEGKPDVGRQREPAVAGDGDTDVEEAEGKPDVGRQREPAVAGDGDTDVEEAEGKPDVGRQREPAVAGDSDTDVEETPDVGQQTLCRAAADSDTDVEEASEAELSRTPGSMGGPAQRRGEEHPAPQSHVSPEAKVVDTEGTEEPTWGPGEESETDVEDDADFALQATQCYLPEEAPCLESEPARAPAPAGGTWPGEGSGD
uniref:Uncharacterized protein n=1 Tax=Pelodiscus sinensis TaxID=13735 RepID=K7GAA1_PELSI